MSELVMVVHGSTRVVLTLTEHQARKLATILSLSDEIDYESDSNLDRSAIEQVSSDIHAALHEVGYQSEER